MTYEQKLAKILGYARDMEDAGLSCARMREAIFSSGGMAKKLFATVEDRAAFVESPHYREIGEIMSRALGTERR